MSQLTVKINGYAYTVACEDGQEQHLQDMVREVEKRVDSVKALGGGASGEGRLLVLAALLMADELHDTAIEMASLRSQMAQIQAGQPITAPPVAAARGTDTKKLARLARKAEDIAAGMEPH